MTASLRSLIILSFVLVLLGLTPLPAWSSREFKKLLSPLVLVLAVANRQFLNGVRLVANLPNLYQQNRTLKGQNDQLLGLLGKNTAIEKENELLRGQLNLPRSRSTRYLLAKVLARDEKGDRLILDLGVRDGVRDGQLVTLGDVLLGKISQADEDQSKVLLTISPESSFDVRTDNLSARGQAVGVFGNKLKLVKVLPSQTLSPGQPLLEISSSLLLGRVEAVGREDAKIFKEADVYLPYDPSLLDEVFIVVSE